MKSFVSKSLCVLGRQPALGLAELESLYGSEHIQPLAGAALLDIDVNDIQFKRLGGTIKLARVLNILPTTKWPQLLAYLKENIPKHLQHLPEGTFTLGLSVYNFNIPAQTLNKNLLEIKKIIRASGRSARVVPNKAPALNSAQVLHNKLTSKGAWELLLVIDGKQTFLAQTMFVQDIEGYGARDQARPKRDARVGMLPPKLAQIIINLANPPAGKYVLDPFCGTGVILQEALLMGYEATGTDIDPRMVDYAKTNLDWLAKKYDIPASKYQVEQADATRHRWPVNIGAVASETLLGKPLKTLPYPRELESNTKEINNIVTNFFKNLAAQLAKGTPVSLALPAWRRQNNHFTHLPLIDHLTDLGYNRIDFKHVSRSDLIYFRKDQIVARQLLVLERR